LNPFLFFKWQKAGSKRAECPPAKAIILENGKKRQKAPPTRRAGTRAKALRTAQTNKQTHPANEQTAGLLRYAISTTAAKQKNTRPK